MSEILVCAFLSLAVYYRTTVGTGREVENGSQLIHRIETDLLGAETDKELTLLFLSSSSPPSQRVTQKDVLVLCPKLHC